MTNAELTTPILHVDGPVATITLNRAAKMNRIEPDDLRALARHVKTVDDDPEVHALILTGTGRAFSAGYHIGDLEDRRAGKSSELEQGATFEDVTNAVENCRVATICGLNGGVYGGATDLALACDFRIGIEGMELLMPAAKLGVHYYQSGLERYVIRLGLAAAKRLFMTAQKIDAEEMLRIGYLDEIVPADQLTTRISALATTIAANAPLSVQNMKRCLNQIARGRLDLDAFKTGYHACTRSSDMLEGMAAWREKRQPEFTGT